MKIINVTKNTILAEEAVEANTIFGRLKGLLGKKELKKGQALILKPCNSIHTLFMRFPIDVIFLDSRHKVVKAIPNLAPWRISGIYLRGNSALELPLGTIEATHTEAGDYLTYSS